MRILLSLFFSVGLVACSTTQFPVSRVHLDSEVAPDALSKKTYLLIPGDEETSWDDPRFQEYATHLVQALNAKGFRAAESLEEADLAVMLSYSLNHPEQYPSVYRMTPAVSGGGAAVGGYSLGVAPGDVMHRDYASARLHTAGDRVGTTFSSSSSVLSNYVVIAGYDLKAYQQTKESVQLWKTTIVSRDSEGAPHEVSTLIKAAAPRLATDTRGKIIRVPAPENDQALKVAKNL